MDFCGYVARQFSPDFTIISAGFDAARGDPLGGCKVRTGVKSIHLHALGSLQPLRQEHSFLAYTFGIMVVL